MSRVAHRGTSEAQTEQDTKSFSSAAVHAVRSSAWQPSSSLSPALARAMQPFASSSTAATARPPCVGMDDGRNGGFYRGFGEDQDQVAIDLAAHDCCQLRVLQSWI